MKSDEWMKKVNPFMGEKRNRNHMDFTFPPLNVMAVRFLAHDSTIMPSDEVLGKIVYVYK